MRLRSPFVLVSLVVALGACSGSEAGPATVDAAPDAASLAELGAEPDTALVPDVPPSAPTYWSAALTPTVDDLVFAEYQGQRLFGLGVHAGPGLIWDGVSGPGECDSSTGAGYLPPETNLEKTLAAHVAGANFYYSWGFDAEDEPHVAVEPPFFGKWHDGWNRDRPVEDDIVPLFFDRFGEVDLGGYSESKAEEMEAEFADFMAREGGYAPEVRPNLPPLAELGRLSWHPTWRMEGGRAFEDTASEALTDEQATRLALALNMMIGDHYTYYANRFDLNDRFELVQALLIGQKGDKGEGYESWLDGDDADHRQLFEAAWRLARSLRTRGQPEALVWMWLQGYSFGSSIGKKECRGEHVDNWCTGDYPSYAYLRKEALSAIVAGATGLIFFGYKDALPEDSERILKLFRVLSHEEVYGPALLTPRLDLGFDTLYMGEEGHDGRGRAHVQVRWDEGSRRAFVLGANPGARETAVALPFPWSLAKAEIMNWETATFEESAELVIEDRTLHYTFPRDEAAILRVTPLFTPGE